MTSAATASASASAAGAAAAPAAVPAWVAPDIPDSIKASFGAWIKGNAQVEAAKAELHLYKRSGYFQGAAVGNVPNLPLAQAWAALQAGSNLGTPPHHAAKTRPEERATMGTALNRSDGKIGIIRLVSLHREGDAPAHGRGSWISSWFSGAGSGGGSSSSSKSAQHGADGSSTTPVASAVGRSASTSCGEPRMVNVLEVGTPEPKPDETKIVLLHGYGAGTAFFFQNINSLASIPNSRLFALDWLGMGRSSRPPFSIPNSVIKQGVEARVKAAESFFVDSLEEWRAKMEIERMTIVAHSLGGYLSLAYALRFPQRVEKIVLVSPAGIGANPQDSQSGMAFRSKNNASADATQELRDTQAAIAPTTQAQQEESRAEMRRAASSSADVRGATPKGPVSPTTAEEDAELERQSPPQLSNRTRAVLSWLWDQNMSPFAIVRASTFLGPMMVARYTSRRFGLLQDDDLRALHAYCHGIFTAKGSSEYCLAHILAPGAFARWPMVERISPLTMPISFIYGQYDWMDVNGGKAAVKALAAAGNKFAECNVVPLAGHHTYLDNPDACNEVVEAFLKKPLPAGQTAA
ncbi:hypothetical protein OC834_001309 [Tilletia horrida]|nr:hypothetical protein OC834_001309 [Tilletia horrida]